MERAARESAARLADLGRAQADLIREHGVQWAEELREDRIESAAEFGDAILRLSAEIHETLSPRAAAIEAHGERAVQLNRKFRAGVDELFPPRARNERRPSTDVEAIGPGPQRDLAWLAPVVYWGAVVAVSLAIVIALILFLEARDISSLGE